MMQHRWLSALLDVLFPPRCVSCGRLGTWFCSTCRQQARALDERICVRCGQPMTERCICHHCRHSPPDPLQGIRGALFYGDPVSFAIHALKYRGMPQLARPLAGYLIAYMQAHPLAFDLLVPVPLHAQRLAARGYNQSTLLAQGVGRRLRLPVADDVIMRSRHTPPQVHLNRRQRLQNMQGAFAPRQSGLLQGQRVLLIDDVCTTGATLRHAAVALRAAGAGEIWALTVARAQPPPSPEPWKQGLQAHEVFMMWDALESPSLKDTHL